MGDCFFIQYLGGVVNLCAVYKGRFFRYNKNRIGGMGMDERAQLLRAARGGNAEAFERLCAPYESLVYYHCLSLLHSREDAQDAAQESMLRAYRAMSGFRGGSGVATWLYRIAHNVCLDMLRKRGAGPEPTSLEELRERGFDAPAEEKMPDERYEARAELERLWTIVQAMPEDLRVMLYLRHQKGYSYEELAEAMGMPMGTVKSKLGRARERIRKQLEEA